MHSVDPIKLTQMCVFMQMCIERDAAADAALSTEMVTI